MCQLRRGGDEQFHTFISQTTGIARKWFHQRGFKSVVTLLLEKQHRIVGISFARLAVDLGESFAEAGSSTSTSDSCVLLDHPRSGNARSRKPSLSIIALTLLWRSHAWWMWQQAVMTTTDPNNTLLWRHSRPGRHASWESPFVKIFGKGWVKIAFQSRWKDLQQVH